MNNPTKYRYDILDALRGVAALSVLCFHLFEGIAFAAKDPTQHMFHGFLAVDFFFILSGFVMGHAYDNQWKEMSIKDFVLRRIVRLHPMVIMGAVLGVAAFILQGCTRWDGSEVTPSTILIGFILALFLIPSPSSTDLRGNTEMFSLNGPHWSLFFEYIGSWCYALLLHRLSDKKLTFWVISAAILLTANSIWMNEGMIAYGWSSEPLNAWGGLLRLSFGYPAGLLIARIYRKCNPQALHLPILTLTGLALILLLSIPHLGKAGLFYQLFCVFIAFPLIIWCGARGRIAGTGKSLARVLGEISYPLYAIHYPLIYLYIYWIETDSSPFGNNGWSTPIALSAIAVSVAFICYKLYDEPLRKRLSSFLKKSKKQNFFR